jgi:Tol biopolymer transport system component
MADLSGRTLGGYQLLSLIGAGGMGEVYRAHDPKLGREVAIKVLPSSVGTDPDRLARFEREARLLAALNHPHIGAIYGTAEADGVHGLVLELVDGETLTTHIARGISVTEALAIAAQIADALDLAHDKGIVHRDLKPDNIKITSDGVVKVLDFGIAKMASRDTEAAVALAATVTAGTLDGMIIGTVAVMSPEQARGKPVDKRADIWAFGCVLYLMLARRPAFPGDTVSDTIVSILEREPDWAALPAALPSNIRRLVQRCLQKDVRRRLRDIGDAYAEIDDVGSVGQARDTGAPSRVLWRFAPWILCAALAAGLAALAVRDRPAVPSATATPTLQRMIRLTNTAAREFGPAISPDGKWVAYYSDARGPTDIWIKYFDSGATLNLTSSLDLRLPGRTNLGSVAISPDGRTLAFAASAAATQAAYDTWVMPAPLGGPPHKLLQGMQGAQWSPDGRQLACVLPGSSLGDALVVTNADGTNQRQIVRAGGGRHIHWPMWSHDGKSIYFIYGFQPWNTEPSEIYRTAASGGTPEPVVRSVRRAVYPVPLPGGDLIYSANPDSVDLGLWWQPANGRRGFPLTNGIGEHAEAQVSADGRRLVSMVLENRESLLSVALQATSAAQAVRAVTDGYGGDIDPSSDPSGDRIVFSSSRSGRRNLWSIRQDGTDARPLTSDTARDHRPVFSPDGRQIAFVSDRGGEGGIWLMSAEGGAPRLLAHAVVLDTLTWSPDGTRILYATPGSSDVPTVLATVSLADRAIRPFTTPATAISPSWSPTADVIAYLETTMDGPALTADVPVSRVELKFVDGQGRPLYPDLPYQRFSNGLLSWAPDGRGLAVVTVPANAPSTLWIVEPGSKTPFRKIVDLQPGMRPLGITWTRDGSRIILSSQESLSDLVLYELER